MLRKKAAAAIFAAFMTLCAVQIPQTNAGLSGSAELISGEYSEKNTATAESCAAELRRCMVARQTTFTLSVPFSLMNGSQNSLNDIIRQSMAETGVSTEGDYLRWAVRSYGYSARPDTSSGSYIVSFTVAYNSTAAEEKQVDEAVSQVLRSLNLYEMSDYEKVRNVYAFVTGNVDYDLNDSDRTIYAAYGAIIRRRAVCQGYAHLMYRMLTELDVPCRIIPGLGNGGDHAWNIVRIGSSFYYIDSTWDSPPGRSGYRFFLRGSSDFDSLGFGNTHVINWDESDFSVLRDCYDSSSFWSKYPLAKTAYSPPSVSYTQGDCDGSSIIDSADASMILKAYANLSTIGVAGLTTAQQLAADVDKNGMIDSADASLVLKYYAHIATGGRGSLAAFLRN